MRAAPSRGRDDVEGQRKFLRTERGIPKDFARIFDAISVDPRDVDFQHEIQSLAADLSVDLSALPRKEFEKRIALQYQKMEVIHDRRALLKKRGEACGALACCDELWRHPTLIEIGNAKKYSKSLLFQLPFQHHPYGVLLNKALISLSSAFEKKLTSKELSQEWKQLWKDFQRTAFTMTQEFQRVDRDVCLYGRQVEWLSGSTSASFVPIFCMAIWGAPSLFPTGFAYEEAGVLFPWL